jgi:hypothetical protein
MIWSVRRFNILLEQRLRSRIHDLGIQSFEIVRAESIWTGLRAALSGLRLLAILGAIFILCRFRPQPLPVDALACRPSGRRRAASAEAHRRGPDRLLPQSGLPGRAGAGEFASSCACCASSSTRSARVR